MAAPARAQSPARPARIALIAGPITGHPKDAHEYEKSVLLLKCLLETSPTLSNKVAVTTFFHGWPESPAALDEADTIVLISDGGDHREADHPLYVGDHFEQFRRQMTRGCGAVLIHWSTFHPSRASNDITGWIGGYFDYDSGAPPNHWSSAIQFWKADARPVPGHPITRGVQPWSSQEEFYYRIRFRGPDPIWGEPETDRRLAPLMTTRPPGESREHTVAWAVQRDDGGRGFATTGGHFFADWWQPDWRRLILNAVAWTARLEVPPGGVDSLPWKRFQAVIVTGANHPSHDWAGVTAELLNALELDPRAQVRVIEDPDTLAQAGSLAGVDLVVWNYVNWQRPGLASGARQALLDYLHRGGGLELVHFGASAFHPSLPGATAADAWPEFSEAIARRVWEHRPPHPSSHDAFGPFRVSITAPFDPIVAGLPPFDTDDELYFNQAGDRPIVPLVSAFCRGSGREEPLAWAYETEGGRVFQTTLGHNPASIRKAAALMRRGGVWAAGRSPLPFDPPAELLEHVLWREGAPWKPRPAEVGLTATLGPSPARPATTSGIPTVSGRDPGAQGEADWVDNRWQQTEIGPVLFSTLALPQNTVTRALVVKVGERGEGAVAYDTDAGAAVACWRGPLASFDPARFGLLHAPKAGAPPELKWTLTNAWTRHATFRGVHLHGPSVALEWDLSGARVLESPSLTDIAGGRVWSRDFDVSADPFGNGCLAGMASDGQSAKVKARPGFFRKAFPASGGELWAFAISGNVSNPDASPDGRPWIRWPANPNPTRFSIHWWHGPEAGLERFDAWVVARPASDLSPLLQPGPSRWKPIETVGQRGQDTGPLAVDTLTLPYDNPWHALLFGSGVDLDSQGAAYFSTIHGDVWRVTGVDADLRRLHWTRFATGLYQPLGLRVRQGEVYVLGRDRITRLRDIDGDGEADGYESFCDGIATSPHGHQYVTSLDLDDSGNFYYTDPAGVHRVSYDGTTVETLATGFRNPNGMGVSPDGRIVLVAPQQGEWTPSSEICEVRPGGYYGFGGPKPSGSGPDGFDPPLCWIPHSVDNSSGGQTWIPTGAWGALGGHFVHFLWGRCGMMLVLRDTGSGPAQGAVVPLTPKFISGPDRGAFVARDGALYVAGSTGWQTSALRDGCLQRVRWTGRPWRGPVGWHACSDGFEFTFSEPLDRLSAEDPGSHALKQWNYRYAAAYGSKDWSVAHPDQEGRDVMEVVAARLSADGRTLFLKTGKLKPVMQVEWKYQLETVGHDPVSGQLWLTVNRPGGTRGD